MIRTSPKPLPRPIVPYPKVERLRERRPCHMTLIAAFRTYDGDVLLCSDRQEDNGISKQSVDKIHRIRGLKQCDVFIAGAGPSTPIKSAFLSVDEAFRKAETKGKNLVEESSKIIEFGLRKTHRRYKKYLETWGAVNFIIVVAPRSKDFLPILYHTEGHLAVPEARYVAHGSGKAVADYLAGRLYADDLMKKWLVILAAFIFRESGESSSGVGFGSDMLLISREGRRTEFWHETVADIEKALPALANCLHDSWMAADAAGKFPEWTNRKDYT